MPVSPCCQNSPGGDTMLRPIPSRILRSTATVYVCTGTDIYENPTFEEYTVNRVHVQPVSEIRKSKDNTDYGLNAILFVDAKRSTPVIDWVGLLKSSHDNAGDMRVVIRNREYTVMTVDELRDDSDVLHHWEVGMR